MPNWASNTIITNNPELIEVFRRVHEDGDKGLFQATVPMPEALRGITDGWLRLPDGTFAEQWRHTPEGDVPLTKAEQEALMEEYGTVSWYDWAVEHWGTKWDTRIDRLDQLPDGSVQVWFDTDWGPPLAWLEKTVAMHPAGSTEIAFSEGGMGFYGRGTWVDGVLVEEDHQEDFWGDFDDFDDLDDPLDGLTRECAAHLEHYGLHAGG
jgi:hypothetical protein